MTRGFEAHITFELDVYKKLLGMLPSSANQVNMGCDGLDPDNFLWKTSRIEGDPVLGQKVYGYLTAYDKSLTRMEDRLKFAVQYARTLECPPIRAKIEQIIYDERF